MHDIADSDQYDELLLMLQFGEYEDEGNEQHDKIPANLITTTKKRKLPTCVGIRVLENQKPLFENKNGSSSDNIAHCPEQAECDPTNTMPCLFSGANASNAPKNEVDRNVAMFPSVFEIPSKLG